MIPRSRALLEAGECTLCLIPYSSYVPPNYIGGLQVPADQEDRAENEGLESNVNAPPPGTLPSQTS